MATLINYRLDDTGAVVPEPDLLAWALWFQETDRAVDDTCVTDARTGKEIRIATTFLGIARDDRMPPILWETIVFGGRMNGEGKRSATLAEAKQAHREFVDRVRGKHSRRVSPTSAQAPPPSAPSEPTDGPS